MSEKYAHKEAFCLMQYRSDDGFEVEILWNSRDGVTPFCIQSRTGKEMRHVNFSGDICRPDHRPKPGDRIFVDATPDLVRDAARAYVEKWWDVDDPNGMGLKMSAHPFFAGHGKEWSVAHFIEYWTKPGSPFVFTVPDEFALSGLLGTINKENADTERLTFIISILQRSGSDGLVKHIWDKYRAWDRAAIDAARATGKNEG